MNPASSRGLPVHADEFLGPMVCGHKIRFLVAHQAPDYMSADGSVVVGCRTEIWSMCNKRLGHRGAHGSPLRWRVGMWFYRLLNLLPVRRS